MEWGLTTMYNNIPDSVQEQNISVEKKLNLIAQTVNLYRKEIEEIKEKENPTTPPEVREQMKQEVSLQIDEMEKQVSTIVVLFDQATLLWKTLEDEEQVK